MSKINLPIILISLIPITLLISSGAAEVTIGILIFSFIILSFLKKDFYWLKEKYILLVGIVWLILIINLIFSNNHSLSLNRAIFFFRYILMIACVEYYFKNNVKFNIIFFIWLLVLLIVSFDIFIEFFNKKNIFGYSSYDPSRISSFLGKELKIGHFVLGFSFLCTGFYFEKNYKKSNFFLLTGYAIFFFFILALTLTGERANTIKGIICFILFIAFSPRKKIKLKKIILIILIVIPISSYFFSDKIRLRYNAIISPIQILGIEGAFKKSLHGAHYQTAVQIFKEYPIFGAGNKNFREECSNKKYYNSQYDRIEFRCSTHPHQIYLELLSEHGIVGSLTIIFVIFYFLKESIKIYLRNQNLIHLGSIVFVSTTFIPIIPSGSFFTSWGAIIFWLNFSIMLFYNKQHK
jgi:O-antigen ligase